MSTKRTYKIETSSIVVIKTITKSELNQSESSLLSMIKEKITRIKPHLTSCKIALMGHIIVIQDELGIATDIEEVLKAYGMKITRIINENNVGNKGNTYLATDELLQLFELLQGGQKSIDQLFNSIYQIDEDLKNIVVKQSNIQRLKLEFENLNGLKENPFIKELIDLAKKNLEVTVNKIEQAMITEYDGRSISKKIISSQSSEDNYVKAEIKLRDNIHFVNSNHLTNIIEGTTKSLEIRARKMGYVVAKKKNGENIQLVLVRGR